MTKLRSGYFENTMSVDETERSYLAYIPQKVMQSNQWPLVLAFHGGGVNAASMVEFSGLSQKADDAGFAVVYPNGSGRDKRFRTWNGGNCCGYAKKYNVNDVGFVDTLLNELAREWPIDQRRVYATGMSNGGVMCYQLANRLADRIAAIAPVAGVSGEESIAPSRGVPICHFHGTADDFVRWEGGVGQKSLSRTNFHSVDFTIDLWKQANGCDSEPEVSEIYDGADDGMPIEKRTFSGVAPIELYRIENGGHTWPGRIAKLEKLGASTEKINANDIMWEFFQRFEL